VGSNVLVARYFGAKKEEELKDTVHTAMMLSLIGGALLTVIGIAGAPLILRWMQSPPEVINLSIIYLRVYFAGITATMIYNFGSSILRAIGDTKRPLYYLTVAGVVNVVLNLIFVIVFHWGVFGVGLATVISQVISAFLVVRCLLKEQGGIRLELKRLGIHRGKLVQIMQIGLPAGFQGMLFSLSNVVIQSSVNSFGATIVAGNSAAQNLEGFVYVGMNAFYQAAISFMGQNVGAGKYNRVNKILYSAQVCVITVGFALSMVMRLFAAPLLSLYTDSPAVVEAGTVRLGIICATYFLCGMMDVMVGALRGLGYSIAPMIVSLLGACAFRLLWIATIFQIDRFHTIETVYTSYPISWTVTFLAHLVTFVIVRRRLKKRWGQ
jgi:putative MATE family efflux protein